MSNLPEIRTTPENVSGYIFESVLLQSDRAPAPFEISRIVTDIEIFEDITRPFLTAKLLLVDNSNLLNNIDLLGGEKVVIAVKSLAMDSKSVIKVFYIDEVTTDQKGFDNTEVVAFHLVEDIEYESNLLNVNKFYNDTVDNIIKKIASEFLHKEVVTNGFSSESNIAVIIPNLHPLEAITWLVNSISTRDGYPYYVFSTLTLNKLVFMDLGSLIELQSINPEQNGAYRNWQSATLSDDPKVAARVIKNYKVEKSENLYNLIHAGFVGATYDFIDTLTNKTNTFDFNVINDLIIPISNKLLPSKQRNAIVPPGYKSTVNDTAFENLQSVRKTYIGGSNAFKNTTSDFNVSYSENTSLADYKKGVVSEAMHSILEKNPLTIVIDGVPFLQGDEHFTIGRNITIQFLNSRTDSLSSDDRLDKKKSGDYLIYVTRHIFKKERYELQLTGLKLANMDR